MFSCSTCHSSSSSQGCSHCSVPLCSQACLDLHTCIGIQMLGDYQTYTEQLLRDGYTVVPVYTPAEVAEKREQFHQTLMYRMPEYLHTGEGGQVPTFEGEHYFHKGGFGALGNPSSFHNDFVRQVRRDAHEVALRVFRPMNPRPARLEQLVDRMRVLRVKAELTAESWHRDTTPLFEIEKQAGAQEGDLIYGGWIAFDGPQLFSAIKGSHRDVLPASRRGFEPFSKDMQLEFTQMKLAAGPNWHIQIPAGHMLIFQQEMIHEVERGKQSRREQPSYRLFTGWRLTDAEEPLMGEAATERFFEKQETPPIKSSQEADMWPDANWRSLSSMENLERWSRQVFEPSLLYDFVFKSGPNAGASFHVIPRYMYSMYEVARKLAARDMIRTFEAQEQVPDEVLTDLMIMVPGEWKLRWTDAELEKRGGVEMSRGIREYMFAPYDPVERQLYKPMPL